MMTDKKIDEDLKKLFSKLLDEEELQLLDQIVKFEGFVED